MRLPAVEDGKVDREVPANEAERLQALAACVIMHTPREAPFDNLVYTAAQIFRAPMAVIGFVDGERAWFKSAVGPLPRELPRERSFLSAVIAGDQLVIVDDAASDPRFSNLPIVTGTTAVRFAAGAPIKGPGGHNLGAICVFDRLTRNTADRQRANLVQLAHEAGELLRMRVGNSYPEYAG